MKNVPTLLAIASLLAAPIALLGQTEQTADVTINVNPVLRLQLQSGDDIAITLSEADYDAVDGTATKAAATETVLRVLSNLPWTVQVKAAAADFDHTPPAPGDPTYAKTVGDLELKRTSDAGFIGLTAADQDVTTGNAGGFGANTFEVEYRIQSDVATDVPGEYTIELTYTVITD
jgi:hypothetical protein